MGEFEIGAFLSGVDGDDEVGALDADAMLDRAGDAGGNKSLGRMVLPVWPICRSEVTQPFCTSGREQPYSAPSTVASWRTNWKFSGDPSPRPPATTTSRKRDWTWRKSRSGRNDSTLVTMSSSTSRADG